MTKHKPGDSGRDSFGGYEGRGEVSVSPAQSEIMLYTKKTIEYEERKYEIRLIRAKQIVSETTPTPIDKIQTTKT